MELAMYLGNDFIASISLNNGQVSEPDYVKDLKRKLLDENGNVLQYTSNQPEFWIVNFSSGFAKLAS